MYINYNLLNMYICTHFLSMGVRLSEKYIYILAGINIHHIILGLL